MAKICESSLSDFNSQPREGGWGYRNTGIKGASNFNSQPREGGWLSAFQARQILTLFQLTAARRRLDFSNCLAGATTTFQLTAARRRLAANGHKRREGRYFNSQPREGGWNACWSCPCAKRNFNSQPREGGWSYQDPC